MVTRKIILGLAAGVALVLVGWRWSLPTPTQSERPNVLLISLDTCRTDRLGCYGHAGKPTPNIDALASSATVFTNAVSPIPLTLPSHSSMLTGTIPPYHGVHDNVNYQLSPSNLTLAEILKSNGYATAAVVGSTVLESSTGIAQGFDSYDDSFDRSIGGPGGGLERSGEDVSAAGIAWLERRESSQFFLFLHYYDAHDPYVPPEPFASRFPNDPYTGEVAYVDHCVGDVLAAVKRLGLYENTLIIITADHAESLGEHAETKHGYFVYNATTRVPLILKLPHERASNRVAKTVALVDIVPTVLDYLELPHDEDHLGTSLLQLVNGNSEAWPNAPAFSESLEPTKYGCTPLLAVAYGEWKYIQAPSPELYNLADDPQELSNLAVANPERASTMRSQLRLILATQHRATSDARSASVDQERLARLQSLGYTGGSVQESFEFDGSKNDPKDYIDVHMGIERMDTHIERGEFVEARQLGESLVAARGDLVQIHHRLARVAMDSGDAERALLHYAESLRIEPDSADAASWHNNMGILLSREKKFGEAVKHYERGLQIAVPAPTTTPDAAQSLTKGTAMLVFSLNLNLGNAQLEMQQYAEAVSAFRNALAIHSGVAIVHLQLSIALAELGQADEAGRAYIEAVRLDPGIVNR